MKRTIRLICVRIMLTRQNNANNFFDNITGVNNEDSAEVAKPLTKAELWQTLVTCKDSAPGPDGIPYTYIKVLWPILGDIIVDAWNYSLQIGKLPISHQVSFLKLIPKVGKDLKKLTNWRPITLSNCDHKLITKCYANRLSDKLNKVISGSQTAYLKGRLISDNIRTIQGALKIASQEDVDGLIVSKF